MNIYPLLDLKTTPDIVHEYPSYVKNNNLPLIIDNGKFTPSLN